MDRNMQVVEREDYQQDGSLEIVDTWRTIQGEGPYAGCPAIFVRLTGCNLRCASCDTDYTSRRTRLSAAQVKESIERWPNIRLVVITGGEPFRQNILPLLMLLTKAGYNVQIETNGTIVPDQFEFYHFSEESVTIVCSPKAPFIHPRLIPRIDALKYVIEYGHVSPGDGLPTSVLGNARCEPARLSDSTKQTPIYLQPCDSQDPETNQWNIQAAIDSCFKFNYRLCLQVHKYLGLE